MKQHAGRWLMHPVRSRVVALLLAVLVWLVWMAAASPSVREMDERSTDAVWRMVASQVPEQRVVLIDIDDASLMQIGPWPWSRDVLAELTQRLDAEGVGLKLFDVVFPDNRLSSNRGVSGIAELENTANARLTQALATRDTEAPSVLAQVFALRGESQLRSGVLLGAVPGTGCQMPSMPAQGFIANAPGLHSRAGHITPTLDADGAVRRLPGFVCFDNRTYLNLALAGIAALSPTAFLNGDVSPSMLPVPGNGWLEPAWQISLPSLPGLRIGMDNKGQMRVPFSLARSAVVSISAADVLNGRLPVGMLKGSWVVIGASAFGLSDAVPTALGSAVTGAEVHVGLLAAILDGKVPFTPQSAVALQLIFALGSIALMLAILPGGPLPALRLLRQPQRQAAVLLPIAAAFLVALAFALHAALLLHVGWFIGWASAALLIALSGSFLTLAEHARSLVEKGLLFRNLSSYVPLPVAVQIGLTEPTGEIQARRSDVTVLAADLQNFSRYCEARPPEDAARVLHRFFSTAQAIVEAHGGVVEEMVGDSLLAVFNGPLACDGHAVKALAAARSLWLRCSEELPNTVGIGLEPLAVSIGIETGMALVGSFGPAQRRVHTVLGQTVTVALRLQALTADVAYPILVGSGAAERIGPLFDRADLALKPLGSFLLPGLQQACKVFTLRTLLQPGSIAEQSTLHYLHQQQKSNF